MQLILCSRLLARIGNRVEGRRRKRLGLDCHLVFATRKERWITQGTGMRVHKRCVQHRYAVNNDQAGSDVLIYAKIDIGALGAIGLSGLT